jgi:hypothetical protein
LLRSSGFVWNRWHFIMSEAIETLIGSPLGTKLNIEEINEIMFALLHLLNVPLIATVGPIDCEHLFLFEVE